jgi:hypothetical protein
MEYVTLRNVTSGSTAGNSVLCEFAPIATSCNNRGIVGSGVFCWARPEAMSRVESAVTNLEADRRRSSQTVAPGGGVGGGGSLVVLSRCVATPTLVVR